MANDTQYELFQHYGTNAERLAFTPSPAAGIQPLYAWYETDTNKEYVYTTAWHLVSSSGGNVTTSATLTANRLILGNGGVDVSLLGSLGTTTTLLHGNAAGAPTFAAVSLTADVTGTLPVANGGTGITSGFSPTRIQTTTLSDAQVKALPTTPITVVAAGGANTVIIPHAVMLAFKAGASAYTNIDAAAAVWVGQASVTGSYNSSYLGNDATTTPPLVTVNDFFGAAGDKYVQLLWPLFFAFPIATGWGDVTFVDTLSGVVNKALALRFDNGGSGNLTGGGTANPITVSVVYSLLTTP